MAGASAGARAVTWLTAISSWPAAQNLAGGFNRLRDEGVITARTAESLCRAVGLRNVQARDQEEEADERDDINALFCMSSPYVIDRHSHSTGPNR